MDTKPLERFATRARRELLAAVDARATAVRADGSVARAERPEVVRKLEAEITQHGRAHVIDKVAYTWFNRIIALRFMDARGYTDAGIVSPAKGQAHGQPEILSEAKRGNIDSDVVTSRVTAETILNLLDGTRRSTDAEGEAYALLLTEYCRYWHKSMPFMFEREGDYTELLVPNGLLADGAILSSAREVMTEDVCDDVEVIGWLYQFYISERKDEVFASFKQNKKAGADQIPAATQLFTPHWIVRYLVENSLGRLWMLNHPGSRLFNQMEYLLAPEGEEIDFLQIASPEELKLVDPACGSGHMLTYAFDLLYAIYEEQGYAPTVIPGLILTHNLHGTEIDPRAGALAAFALAMKARARQRNFLNTHIEPKICVIAPISFSSDELNHLVTVDGDSNAEETFWNQFAEADTFGSLIQPDPDLEVQLARRLDALNDGGDMIRADLLDRARQVIDQAEYLMPRYHVVVANPPYMGAKNMSPMLVSFVKKQFPSGKQDLYGCFAVRAMGLAVHGGFVAKIIGDTWMSIGSFESLRAEILAGHSFDSFVHLRDISNHPDIFGANAAFVLAMSDTPGRKTPFIRLTSLDGAEKREALLTAIQHPQAEWRFAASSVDLAKIPGIPIAYWLSDRVRGAFAKGASLAEIAPPRNGLQTSDNGRFLRFWWEVSADQAALGTSRENPPESRAPRWFPYNKGGEYRRWYGNQLYVVNWENDGQEVRQSLEQRYPYLNGNLGALIRASEDYFKPHISWSAIGSGEASFREYPSGLIFDAAANALFPHHNSTRRELLAILNSSVASAMLPALAPTMNFVVSAIAKVPIVLPAAGSTVPANVDALVATSKADWDSYERSWDFDLNPLLGFREDGVSLAQIVSNYNSECDSTALRQQQLEIDNNEVVAALYDLAEEVRTDVDLSRVSLTGNSRARYGAGLQDHEYRARSAGDAVADLVSYAVGTIFGRFSLDKPGLILGDQGAAVQNYYSQIPSPTLPPDVDNVIPFVEDGWFEDDIVERVRQFLRVAFGPERFEDNLRFVEESLGVKRLRDHFISQSGKSKFYEDHVQRFKKRPIYWMFSSPKGSFNALIYMHRYNPSTVSIVLNEYLREYRAKLEVALVNADQAAATGSSKDQKEADRLRKVLAELSDYEHDVLYPLATQQIAINLDDGVKTNYPKFYPALRKIAGLEAAE